MASEKDPSIYYDRGTIGSSDELDEYGVWVKSEPQDLSSANAENQELSDSTLPELADLPDFDADAGIGDADYDSFSFEDESDEAAGLGDDDLGLPEIDMPEPGDSSGEDFSDGDLPDGGLDPDAIDEEGFTEVSMDDFLGDDSSSMDLGDALPMEDLQDTNFDTEFDDAEFDNADTIADTKEETDMPDFDDVAAVSQDLRNSGAEKAKSAAPDLSTQLLMKIAEELASIKNELSSLKTELAGVRGGGAPAQEAAEESGGGFFDEEDDEKIALTGDELDNILNTADFTEEAGSDATEEFSEGAPGDDADFAVPPPAGETDLLSDQPDIIDDGDISLGGGEPELDEIGGEYEPQEASADVFSGADFDIAVDNGPGDSGPEEELSGESPDMPGGDLVFDDEISIKLSEDDFSDTSLDDSAPEAETEDSEELRRLRTDGARPMTPAPDDTSYLEEDPLAFDDGSLDLSNAVIDEPDLSGEITENPIEEPAIEDIALDLDFEDISVPEEAAPEEEGSGEEAPPEEDLAFEEAAPPEDIVFEEETELELPEESQETVFDDSFDMPSPEEDAGARPEEESFSQVVPDGFEVEIEDSQPEEAGTLPAGDDLGFVSEEPAETGPVEEAEAREAAEPVNLPVDLKQELKTVLSYMDQLLESLPEDKIEEFARSEYFDTYKKLFEELGLA